MNAAPAPQSVLLKNNFLMNAAQMSLTLRNFLNLIELLKRHKVSDFHRLKFKNPQLRKVFFYNNKFLMNAAPAP